MASVIRNYRNVIPMTNPFCVPSSIRNISVTTTLNIHKLIKPRLISLQMRKDKLIREGKFPTFARSQFIEWNYEAERYAFCKRISEEIHEDLLIKLFNATENELLIRPGRIMAEEFCHKFLRYSWPTLPEEGISSACAYLLHRDKIAKLAQGIGMKDLIITEGELDDEIFENCFYSLLTAIKKSSGVEKAEKFILDLIITQVVGKDLWDLWALSDPYAIVNEILERSGRQTAERRILGVLGKGTLETVVRVGIYSDKKLLGEGCEHTAEDGLKIASYDCLSKFFDQALHRDPINFDSVPVELQNFEKPNRSLENWTLSN